MLDRIVKFIDKLVPVPMAPDKKAHLTCGFLIAVIFSIIFDPVIGFWIGTVAAIGKEVRDEIVYNGFDAEDLLVTMIGVVVGSLLVSIIVNHLL